MARGAVSLTGGVGSSLGFVTVSFLLLFCAGSGAGWGASVSGFTRLGLFRMGIVASFWIFASVFVLAPVLA
jgi:hypothetical protein